MLIRLSAQLLRGFFMGSADVVPGVSGGTVALVFGIYETLVHQVRMAASAGLRALRLDFMGFASDLRRLDWAFILPLAGGIVAAVLTLAPTIDHFLETQPEETAAAFFGLVAASIVVAWGHLRRRDNLRLVVLVVSAVITFFVLGLRTGTVSDPQWWQLIGAGALAICAMILPGISGSFILLMIGMYDAVLEGVNERDLMLVVLFGVGAAVGLAAFSSALDRVLETHHDTVLAALIGLMAGSLRVLWPWPEGVESSRLYAPPAGEWLAPLVIALIGAVVVLGMVRLGVRRESASHHV